MPLWLSRLISRIRRARGVGVLGVVGLVAFAIFGNALTFYIFDGANNPEIGMDDALWYSVISVTTIGYGDLSASSLPARLGTVFFIVLIGLSAFSMFLGLLVDWVVELQQKELHGMTNSPATDHILIINFPSESRVQQIIAEIRQDEAHAKSEIVIVTDQISQLPFNLPLVGFVRGSPLQGRTFERAGIERAKIAVILSPSPEDSSSDSIVASIGSVLEHMNRQIKTVAECVDDRHDILFRSSGIDAVVYTNRIANHLLVQETHDTGVTEWIDSITTVGVGQTVFSAVVGPADAESAPKNYAEIAKKMIDRERSLLAVVRENRAVTRLGGLDVQAGDIMLYLGNERTSARELIG